jgi:hypothetical protein
MASKTEREKVKGMMDLLNTGIQFPPDISVVFEETFVVYKCGCRGKVHCVPMTKKRTIKLLLYCFCKICLKCSAIPTKLIIYNTELEFDPMSKKPFSQDAVYRTETSYEQFAKYYELD